MKDEIKLKDMTDFLENVYKDIKKQPTLEEELEKERKFINKIKGDNKDEIKEILEEINKIIDNTSYNEEFTYFQTSHISKLLDYITNLQQIEQEHKKINGELREEIKALNNIINELEKELELNLKFKVIGVKRLKNKLKELKEGK